MTMPGPQINSAAPVLTAYHSFDDVAALKLKAKEDPDSALRQVAQQFESIFIQMMLKSMRDSVEEGGLFSSNQMETYQEMADQQIALNMSQSGGIGLADLIAEQLGANRATSASGKQAAEAYSETHSLLESGESRVSTEIKVPENSADKQRVGMHLEGMVLEDA